MASVFKIKELLKIQLYFDDHGKEDADAECFGRTMGGRRANEVPKQMHLKF